MWKAKLKLVLTKYNRKYFQVDSHHEEWMIPMGEQAREEHPDVVQKSTLPAPGIVGLFISFYTNLFLLGFKNNRRPKSPPPNTCFLWKATDETF